MVLVESGCHCCTSFWVHVRLAAAFRVVEGSETCKFFSNGYFDQVCACDRAWLRLERD